MTKLITSAHTAIFHWVEASANSLPTGSLRPERERVEYHEKHPRPADQDGLVDCVIPLPSHEQTIRQR